MINSADVAGVIASVSAAAASVGYGAQWIISRIDAREKALQDAEDKARADLAANMQKQIDDLTRAHIATQNRLDLLTQENNNLNRHIGILIGIIQSHNIPVPDDIFDSRPVAAASTQGV